MVDLHSICSPYEQCGCERISRVYIREAWNHLWVCERLSVCLSTFALVLVYIFFVCINPSLTLLTLSHCSGARSGPALYLRL
mgnify:FL=1